MKYFDEKLNYYFKFKKFSNKNENELMMINEVGYYKTIIHSIEKNKKYPGEVLLFYVLSGQGIISYKDEYIALVPNDLMIIDTNENFFISNNNWEISYSFISGKILHQVVDKVCEKDCIFDYHLKSTSVSFFNKAFEIVDPFAQYFLINRLLSELFFGSQNKLDTTKDMIRNALLYIENHYNEKITIDDISSYVGYSEFYFSRAFKKAIGESPYSFIIKRRLQQSQLLLLTTNTVIEEIAKECGFINENNFYTYFNKTYGVTPNQYRKINK